MTRREPGPAAHRGEMAFVQRHQASLWRFLVAVGADATTAEDLVQDTFVAALRADLVDRGEAAARTWLRRTARNLFLAHCRTARRSPVRLDPEQVERALHDYERHDHGRGYREALDACLDALPAEMRDQLLVAARADVGLTQLAAAAHTSTEALRSRLRRLRDAVRACVQRRLRDEENT